MTVKEKNSLIIEGIRTGDEQIITSFYKIYLPQIVNYVVNNSGTESDGKDLFQDALVIVFKKIKDHTLSLDCALHTYVFGICKNLWLNRLRKGKKIMYHDNETILNLNLEIEIPDNLDREEKIAVIQKQSLKLGKGCRRILLMFYRGYSLKEIAISKNFTEGYTRKRKFECQKKLIEFLEKDPVFQELKQSSKYP